MRAIIFSGLVLFAFGSVAQVTPEQSNQIELASEEMESESLELTDWTERLEWLVKHPVNLNTCTRADLELLPWVSSVQIEDLMRHRSKFGRLISIYELQALPYWDLATIRQILPYVDVVDRFDNGHFTLAEALKYGRFESFSRAQWIVQSKAGYSEKYAGDPFKMYQRIRWSYRSNLSVGMLAEKDPGESILNSNGRPDFVSAHAFYSGGKFLKAVALGDFHIQIGQGLNFWTGFANGKSTTIATIHKVASNLRPYTSVDENRFLRGAGMQLGYGQFDLQLFGSVKQLDGRIESDTIRSINYAGLHRTESEIERSNNVEECILGGYLTYRLNALKIGVAGVNRQLNRPFRKDFQAYNLFSQGNQRLSKYSVDYAWTYRNFTLFGEGTSSEFNRDFAVLNGVVTALNDKTNLSILHRTYSRNAQYFEYQTALSEGNRPQNESGVYVALETKLTRKWSCFASADLFEHPWLKYLVHGSSSGHEFLIQPNYRLSRYSQFYIRIRHQQKMKNSRWDEVNVKELEPVQQQNIRLHFKHVFGDKIRWQSRIEWTKVTRPSNAPETGWLMYQDFVFQPKKLPIDLAFRYALFDTDGYDSRIYAYESNALYVFSIPAHYYTGSRFYLLIRYDFWKVCSLWVRFAKSVYDNRTELGSGNERILGNEKSECTVQLRIKF